MAAWLEQQKASRMPRQCPHQQKLATMQTTVGCHSPPQVPLRHRIAQLLKRPLRLHSSNGSMQVYQYSNNSTQQTATPLQPQLPAPPTWRSSRQQHRDLVNGILVDATTRLLRNDVPVDNDELADRRNIVFERFAGRMAVAFSNAEENIDDDDHCPNLKNQSRLTRFKRSLGKSLARRLPRALVNLFRKMSQSRNRYSHRVAVGDDVGVDSELDDQLAHLPGDVGGRRSPQMSFRQHQLRLAGMPPPPPPPPSATAVATIGPRSSTTSLAGVGASSGRRTSSTSSSSPSSSVLHKSRRSVEPTRSLVADVAIDATDARQQQSVCLRASHSSSPDSSGQQHNSNNNLRRASILSAATGASRKSSIGTVDEPTPPRPPSLETGFKAHLPRSQVMDFAKILQGNEDDAQLVHFNRRQIPNNDDYDEYEDQEQGTTSLSSASSHSSEMRSLLSLSPRDTSRPGEDSSADDSDEEADFESDSELVRPPVPMLATSASYNHSLHQSASAAASSCALRNEPLLAHSRSIQSHMSRASQQQNNYPQLQHYHSQHNHHQHHHHHHNHHHQAQTYLNNSFSQSSTAQLRQPQTNQPTAFAAKRLSLQFTNSNQPLADSGNLSSAYSRSGNASDWSSASQCAMHYQANKYPLATSKTHHDSRYSDLMRQIGADNSESIAVGQYHRNSIAAGEAPLRLRSVSYVTNFRMFTTGLANYESRRANELDQSGGDGSVKAKRQRLMSSAASCATAAAASAALASKKRVDAKKGEVIIRRKSLADGQSFNNSTSGRLSDVPPVAKMLVGQRQPQDNLNAAAACATQQLQQRVIIQATTTELMQCLCDFLFVKCRRLQMFRPSVAYGWLREVDKTLLTQGWQEIAFINPANIVFLYMLLRDLVSEGVESIGELQMIVMTSLYLSYSYMGNEISYPLQPFLCKQDRHDRFWDRTLYIIELMSGQMLKLNADAAFFAEVFAELKSCQSLIARAAAAAIEAPLTTTLNTNNNNSYHYHQQQYLDLQSFRPQELEQRQQHNHHQQRQLQKPLVKVDRTFVSETDPYHTHASHNTSNNNHSYNHNHLDQENLRHQHQDQQLRQNDVFAGFAQQHHNYHHNHHQPQRRAPSNFELNKQHKSPQSIGLASADATTATATVQDKSRKALKDQNI